jgi:hypothetical protein
VAGEGLFLQSSLLKGVRLSTAADDGFGSWAAFAATFAARPLYLGELPILLRCSGRQPWAVSSIADLLELLGANFASEHNSSDHGADYRHSYCHPDIPDNPPFVHAFSLGRLGQDHRTKRHSDTYLIATFSPVRASLAKGFAVQASAVRGRPPESVHEMSTDSMPEDLTTRAVVCVPWVITS